MNALTFFRLIRGIYGRRPADLDFIQRSGLLAVKIAQVHALRLDFLDEKKCSQLAQLYRQADRVPPLRARRLLETAAEPALLENLALFQEQPLASASVGQVHRAKLKDGREMAIKLIKQDAAASFRADVRSVRRLFQIASLLYPKLRGVANPAALLRQIEVSTLAELDLRNETAGHRLLEKIWQEHSARFDLSDLRFGQIFEEYSNQSVMASEYLPGPTADELIEQGRLSYEDLLRLFRVHGYFIFAVGIFHGDLHPGNIIISGGKFHFIDSGYIGRANRRISDNLLLFFRALGEYDYRSCAAHLHAMSERQLDEAAYREFEKKFISLYQTYTGATVSQVSLTRQMMLTIRLAVLSGMVFSEGIFDIIKTLMYMDGMVLKVNPKAKLVADLKPFTYQFTK